MPRFLASRCQIKSIDVLYSLPSIQDYLQAALRKKQLIASFREHFKRKP